MRHIFARRVSGPDGQDWRVGRQWRLWRPRRRQDGNDLSDLGDVGDLGDDLLIGVIIAVVVLVLIVLLSPLFWVGLLALEVALALLLVPVAVLWRVLFRRPWTVYAHGDAGGLVTERVVGWRASSAVIRRLCLEIEQTGVPGSSGRGAQAPGPG